MEREGKHEVQTCSIDETCQSKLLHGITTLSCPGANARDKSSMLAVAPYNPYSKITRAVSGAFNVDVRLMN